jgi:PAS domain S-box-containing protein
MTQKHLNSEVFNAVQRNEAESLKQTGDELRKAYQELMRNNAILLGENIELMRTIEELRKQKEILQKIFDNIPILIYLNDEDGQIEMVNREWERTLEWSLKEIQQEQLDIYSLCYPSLQERQKVLEFIAEEKGEWCDFKTTVRDGRVIDTSWTRI